MLGRGERSQGVSSATRRPAAPTSWACDELPHWRCLAFPAARSSGALERARPIHRRLARGCRRAPSVGGSPSFEATNASASYALTTTAADDVPEIILAEVVFVPQPGLGRGAATDKGVRRAADETRPMSSGPDAGPRGRSSAIRSPIWGGE